MTQHHELLYAAYAAMHQFPGAASPWWSSPMPKKVNTGVWWSHSGKTGGNSPTLFIATCSCLSRMPFQTSHEVGGTTISLLPVGTIFSCLCQRGTGGHPLNSQFPTQTQKTRSQILKVIHFDHCNIFLQTLHTKWARSDLPAIAQVSL